MKKAEKALRFLMEQTNASEYTDERDELRESYLTISLIMEEYASQNTLNRDKVRRLIYDYTYPKEWKDKTPFEETKYGEDLADTLCSLTLPTLSEEEIDEIWFKYFDKMTDLMDYEGFKAALKQLTKPKEG
jgi:hypothetical protein